VPKSRAIVIFKMPGAVADHGDMQAVLIQYGKRRPDDRQFMNEQLTVR
jgi:hypothetical protein